MKSKTDLVKGWLKKADSDVASARTCLASNEALDTVCFHAQQAAVLHEMLTGRTIIRRGHRNPDGREEELRGSSQRANYC